MARELRKEYLETLSSKKETNSEEKWLIKTYKDESFRKAAHVMQIAFSDLKAKESKISSVENTNIFSLNAYVPSSEKEVQWNSITETLIKDIASKYPELWRLVTYSEFNLTGEINAIAHPYMKA